jgi:ferric-dicitrate binding protein FerR (iron transport regulator)
MSSHLITIRDVSTREQLAVEAWKKADAQAREAELRLKAAWEQYEIRRDAPPSEELMGEVARLRRLANEKLGVAMMLMSRKV